MKFNRLIILAICSLGVVAAAQEKQFICNFGAEVKMTKLVPDNPSPKISKSSTKFTFIVDDKSANGKYVNLSHGIVSPILFYTNGSTATFIEKNSSDNLFVVTAFLESKDKLIPAVFTQFSWQEGVQVYGPYMSLGSCSVSRL